MQPVAVNQFGNLHAGLHALKPKRFHFIVQEHWVAFFGMVLMFIFPIKF